MSISNKDKQRKCVGCGIIKPREDMIKITKVSQTGEIFVNPDSKIFGRSVYLCYNNSCIENALKKNRLNKALKTTKDLKGLLNGQYESKRISERTGVDQ